MPEPATDPAASQKLTLVIVGGVAGGASAAARARRMNEHARIILLEKDAYISFANCGLPYYLGGEIADRQELLVASPELFKQRFNIEVRTHTEALRIDREAKTLTVLDHNTGNQEALPYDKLVLAPGASPLVPPIPGIDAPNVYTLRNLEDTDRIFDAVAKHGAKRAVVIGAGFIGLEVAEQFRDRGMDVALVELQPQVLPLLDAEMAQPLADALRQRGIALHLGDGIKSVKTDASTGLASAVQLNSGAALPADLVLMGIGVRPNVQLAKDAQLPLGDTGGIATDSFMRTADPDIYAVGDAAEYPYRPTGSNLRVPLAGPANRAGRLAGEHAVTGNAEPTTPVLGTSIVRVFGLAAGLTGLTLKAAQRAGIDATAVHIIANHHAGYYPGAQPMTLKLLYAPDSGKILGAQAVGGAGVDKRLDVIATAMHFGGTVHDLVGLDLAYAPPFGSAKDPVHMAGFAASNQLAGHMKVVQPDADLAGYQVVDVRSDAEVAKAPLTGVPHVKTIPLDNLRDRLGELDASQPTVVSCASGLRSYVAGRILMQHGFTDVANLSGASTLRQRAADAGMLAAE